MYTLGIDIGSITTKAAVMEDKQLLNTKVIFTGYNAEGAANRIIHEILAESKLDRDVISSIIATGYGRKSVTSAKKAVTEIMCHGAGACFLNPQVRTIIDIGGQDSKVIAMDPSGKVINFAMNDKCAAGTGRFLEVMARALEVDLDDFGTLSLQADTPAKISSLCTVFAESEVISLIARGEERKNIIAGIHESIATRVSAMVNRVGLKEPVMMTGGVAKNLGVVKALEDKIGLRMTVSSHAQATGAIGAACLAFEC
ncbi:MAG: (R)-phenyllactate dehydratase activator [Syntrophus sp. SKADARSKE-3]|nr:(R)-phenyllactate dehydratase activator [Syntrophus sp. SKADARSKE-3]